MSFKAKRAAGLLPMYERQASEYFDRNKKTGLHEDIKDGYISSTAKMDGMGKLVDTLHNEGGGFYGEDAGEKTYIYKKAQQQSSPAPQQQAPAPEPEVVTEPEKDKGPVEYSPEVASAKERVQKFKGTMDGFAGSTFNTDASNEEEAQGLADKYKLNLLGKGAGQSDFTGV